DPRPHRVDREHEATAQDVDGVAHVGGHVAAGRVEVAERLESHDRRIGRSSHVVTSSSGTVTAMTDDAGRARLEAALDPLDVPYELFPCDPALGDTAQSCAAYGFSPDESANTIVVVGKSDPRVYAACIVLATHRLDVNRTVRDRLGTRKASFAGPDETRELTGMEIGGVTPFGLPDHPPGWIGAERMSP